ncbi:mitochondrial protein-like protein Fmp25 [Sporormia fimetaria CBS 119925]|uniref:Mitochondrial protein-like protein Fmp25 n=1 Tax=Sporormia fimetaria CBS 119925 TaxID=1340428 RepID=A0A6A6VR28_9PLEO|nr:mitochondrial protein-like protein Fmp25 [Sporormia fimetaria CBS 119925]
MLSTRCLVRTSVRAPQSVRLHRSISNRSRSQARVAVHPYAQRRQQHFVRSIAALTVLGATATAFQYFTARPGVDAEAPPQHQDPTFEKPRRAASSTEDNRELISSQHLQVKKSWENPGVYLWGANSGRVAAPDSNEKYVKTPRRLAFFDNVLLRDIKLDRNFGAAIDEKGDLLQWGTAFSPKCKEPTRTLKGKDLVSCAVSRDRIIALSSSGAVYSVPVSQEEQKSGPKPKSASWIPFISSTDDISYRVRTPSGLGWSERVTEIASGAEHALLRTSAGRLFAMASATQDFPRRGQLGIAGLTFENRPEGPFDTPHEITTLTGFSISKIAAGDHHSLVCDTAGRCFTWGDNTAGQLGFDFNQDQLYIDTPSLLPTQKLYASSSLRPSVTDVFAGGNTSYLTIEATKPGASKHDPCSIKEDTWAFGFGLNGQLGTGHWTHVQNTPVKVPSLSGLSEYDEKTSSVIPIKLAYLSAGATHAAAVLDNVSSVDVAKNPHLSENDINWGRDILFWGNNEFYQIGSGKRNNVATPTYIQALDQRAELEREKSAGLLEWGKEKMETQWHRFQITPKKRVNVKGRMVDLEQKVECGRGVTAVYSAV